MVKRPTHNRLSLGSIPSQRTTYPSLGWDFCFKNIFLKSIAIFAIIYIPKQFLQRKQHENLFLASSPL